MKVKMEKKCLLDTVASAKRIFTILNDIEKVETEHMEATLELRLATQKNEHDVAIGLLKLQIKEKDLEASFFQSEIKRLRLSRTGEESNAKKYDNMMAQSLKSRIQMKDVYDKAEVRYVIMITLYVCILLI